MIRPIPEALTWSELANDVDLLFAIDYTQRRWAESLGQCRFTRLGRAVSLGYRRDLDPSVMDTKGDYL